MWGALIQAALQIVPQITGKMEADRVAKAASAQHKLDAGVEINADLEQSARAIGRAVTLGAASGGGLTGSALHVLDDLSRQAMAKARAIAYTRTSQAAEIARGTITRQQVIAGTTQAVTPLLTSWAGRQGGFGGGGGGGGLGGAAPSSGGNLNTGGFGGGGGGNANFGGM